MRDPLEGVSPIGTITTGVSRERIAVSFQPVLDAAVAAVQAAHDAASLYVYGSVATGLAQPPNSDVDLLTIELLSTEARSIARELSQRFVGLCRAVAIAPAQRLDFSPDTDEGYGGRVFLKHYCLHLTGPDLHSDLPDFAADARAARGFNGDIAEHAERWRTELDEDGDPARVGLRLARKTLFAVTGLVSVHDDTWTTDRTTAAPRWAEVEPALADDLQMLLAWAGRRDAPDRASVRAALDGIVARVVAAFQNSIGLWGTHDDRSHTPPPL